MESFNIRKAILADADRIAFVRITGWRQSYKGLMPDALLDKLSIEADARRVRDGLSDSANRTLRYVVELEGKIVGMGACGQARHDPTQKHGEVYAIYLLNEAKGQGIGSAFMREMAAALQANGFESLQVSVLANNLPARAFYEKLGGKLAKNGFFKYEGYELPDVTYVWEDLGALLPGKR